MKTFLKSAVAAIALTSVGTIASATVLRLSHQWSNSDIRHKVARFHLGNGAIIHAIHEGADTSDKGIAQSYGTMVNYLYDFDVVEKNMKCSLTNV